ncbi:MAG: 3-deoxy-manno-octulosonate cytidylyltransferase [Candidatus Eisenbacteria bacterium]|nr:3-deoxy-manno-octulosonate cytidylyltransferase [Candidatus Eisenbacteria bacterium]
MSVSSQKIVGVIPARYAATRFPGKLLASLGGRTVLGRAHERAAGARSLDRLLVATDDERILREVLAFGGEAVMTRSSHRSGTDRVAEAVSSLGPEYAFVVNIQGDEPFLDPVTIDELANGLRSDPAAIWTAVAPIRDEETLARPDVVKAVVARDRRVLYFSRAPLPYRREGTQEPRRCWHHIGVYGFDRGVLERFVRLPVSSLEDLEGLEQLRALEEGIPIRVIITESSFGGIDTREDLDRANRFLAAEAEGRDSG